MAIRTLAICDKCGRKEAFGGGRTNSEIVDSLVSSEGWTSENEYKGLLKCDKCSEEAENEETPNEN